MGKAIIVSHLGSAKYEVDVVRTSAREASYIKILVKEAAEVRAGLPALLARALASKSTVDNAKIALDNEKTSIGTYISALSNYEVDQTAYLAMLARAQDLENTAAERAKELLPRRTTAWCSTYNVSLPVGKEIGTIEVANQADQYPFIVLQPEGAKPVASDGCLRTIKSMTPAQAFYNYALAPGIARWRPRYRSGLVTDVNLEAKTLEVWLDTPTVAGIYIHDEPSTVNLPYGAACSTSSIPIYQVMDKVIVQFNSTTHKAESVIGWAEWPREFGCNPSIRFGTQTYYQGAGGYTNSNADWENSGRHMVVAVSFPIEEVDAYNAINEGCFSFTGASMVFAGKEDMSRTISFWVDTAPLPKIPPLDYFVRPPGRINVKMLNPLTGEIIASTLSISMSTLWASDETAWGMEFAFLGFGANNKLGAGFLKAFAPECFGDVGAEWTYSASCVAKVYSNGALVKSVQGSFNPESGYCSLGDADNLAFTTEDYASLPAVFYIEGVIELTASYTVSKPSWSGSSVQELRIGQTVTNPTK